MWDLSVTAASIALFNASLRPRAISIVGEFSKKEAQATLKGAFWEGSRFKNRTLWSNPRDDFKGENGEKVGTSATR